jgi:hypothetical protein
LYITFYILKSKKIYFIHTTPQNPIAAPANGNKDRQKFNSAHFHSNMGTSSSSFARRTFSAALTTIPSVPSATAASSRVACARSRLFVLFIAVNVQGTMPSETTIAVT